MAQDPNEMTKKNKEGYNQKYTDDTKENESVRDAILNPIKNVAGKIVKGVTKAGDKLKAVSDRAKGKGMGTAGRMQPMQPMKKEEEVEKKSNGGAVHTMPDGKKMKGAKHGMKHGGAVKGKKCRMDGMAVRGKTRARQRSK